MRNRTGQLEAYILTMKYLTPCWIMSYFLRLYGWRQRAAVTSQVLWTLSYSGKVRIRVSDDRLGLCQGFVFTIWFLVSWEAFLKVTNCLWPVVWLFYTVGGAGLWSSVTVLVEEVIHVLLDYFVCVSPLPTLDFSLFLLFCHRSSMDHWGIWRQRPALIFLYLVISEQLLLFFLLNT